VTIVTLVKNAQASRSNQFLIVSQNSFDVVFYSLMEFLTVVT